MRTWNISIFMPPQCWNAIGIIIYIIYVDNIRTFFATSIRRQKRWFQEYNELSEAYGHEEVLCLTRKLKLCSLNFQPFGFLDDGKPWLHLTTLRRDFFILISFHGEIPSVWAEHSTFESKTYKEAGPWIGEKGRKVKFPLGPRLLVLRARGMERIRYS